MKINCVILDDEPYAVKLIRNHARRISSLNVCFSGTDIYEAINVINDIKIDLVFIDILMPELTGIEVMELINQKQNFIITTAYPEYAIDSYKFNVIDYLLKPIVFSRFYQSVEKYKRWKSAFAESNTNDILYIRSNRKDYRISINSINYIEGLKDYIRIHTQTDKMIVLENMKDIMKRLPATQFIRVHRSYIISIDQVKTIEGNQIQLSNGKKISIGETYREKFKELLLSN